MHVERQSSMAYHLLLERHLVRRFLRDISSIKFWSAPLPPMKTRFGHEPIGSKGRNPRPSGSEALLHDALRGVVISGHTRTARPLLPSGVNKAQIDNKSLPRCGFASGFGCCSLYDESLGGESKKYAG